MAKTPDYKALFFDALEQINKLEGRLESACNILGEIHKNSDQEHMIQTVMQSRQFVKTVTRMLKESA